MPIPEAIPSVTWVVPSTMSFSSLVLLPSPYIVILSTLLSGAATFWAISGRALTIISIIAASPYCFIASAFSAIPLASASSLASIASASAKPTALTPAASCSLWKRKASALAFSASACLCSSYSLASASFFRLNRSASACCSSR